MSIVDKAIWIIERNSERALTLDGIAEACGVSRSHLAYAFGAATGLSVMRYLRGRRLTEAARVLVGGAPDILAVALGAGYGSHEAFTRAFGEQFGVTPESVRERRSLDGVALIEPIALEASTAMPIEPPRLIESPAIRVVGLVEHCTWEGAIKIPAQWQRFMPYVSAIPAPLQRFPVGVGRVTDDDGQFDYICGIEVARFGEIPPELVQLEIPKRTYAAFQHRRHIMTLRETYVAIWNKALPELGRVGADAPLIERHNPTFDPRTGEGGVELWVPLV
jgi:AraC family transcriptional regulator